MWAAGSSKKLVTAYRRTTWCYNAEDHSLNVIVVETPYLVKIICVEHLVLFSSFTHVPQKKPITVTFVPLHTALAIKWISDDIELCVSLGIICSCEFLICVVMKSVRV
jgi:hypothetical protein